MQDGDWRYGAAIHVEDAEELFSRIAMLVPPVMFKGKHIRIDLLTPARLPTGHCDRDAVAQAVITLLATDQMLGSVGDVRLTAKAFEPAMLGFDARNFRSSLPSVLEKVRDEENGHVAAVGNSKGVVVVTLRSERDSKVRKETLEAMREASAQLSRTQPGLIWTHFVDLWNAELAELVALDERKSVTALKGIAYRLFNSRTHDHLAAILFSAHVDAFRRGGPDAMIIHPPFVTQQGHIYPLWNSNCRLNTPFVEFM